LDKQNRFSFFVAWTKQGLPHCTIQTVWGP